MNSQFKIFGLGADPYQGARMFLVYAYLKARKAIGRKTPGSKMYRFRLAFEGKTFDYHVKEILDFHLLREIFIDRHYAACERLEPPPACIVDLGSNIGATAIYFKLLFPGAQVYCFEPNPACVKSLEKNVEQFGGTAKVFPVAVAGQRGRQTFYSNQEHWSSSLIDRRGTGAGIEVETVTLDDVLENMVGQKDVDLLKFDIEGAEYEAFRGLRDAAKIRYLIGEIHPTYAGKSVDEFVGSLKGFSVISLVKAGSHFHGFFRQAEHV